MYKLPLWGVNKMLCNRKACKAELTSKHGYYKIYNDPSTNAPNTYCVSCGRKIIEYNKACVLQDHDHIELKYEVVKD